MAGAGPRPLSDARFLADALVGAAGDVVVLEEACARHARVLRLAAGDEVELFDGKGASVLAVVESLEGGAMRVRLTDAIRTGAAADPSPVHLVLGVPKGDKLDTIVRMSTELGVASIHLALMARSIARASGAERMERLARIAEEAARQSRRVTVPALSPPQNLATVVTRVGPDDQRLVAYEAAEASLESATTRRTATWVVVGPEGGVAADELEVLSRAGFAAVSLGPTTLRVETAAPVAVALLRARLVALP